MELNGGGPQGALWGILEYFKYIDDLSILEKANLLCIGLSTYNFKQNVASDIPQDGFFLDPENLKTQDSLNRISEWTKQNQMLLNIKKTKTMNFNFTRNHQFASRLKIENEVLETITETKLLGVIVTDTLSWDPNTKYIVKRANARMRMLHKLVEFNVPVEDLLIIYILYIRSVLEQSCQVWHSSLTFENLTDIERVQKNALRIILKEDYNNYAQALLKCGLDSLVDRRELLCLKFARSALKNENVKDMFPPNLPDSTEIRDREPFKVTFARTDRLKTSAIPYMQRLLNANK